MGGKKKAQQSEQEEEEAALASEKERKKKKKRAVEELEAEDAEETAVEKKKRKKRAVEELEAEAEDAEDTAVEKKKRKKAKQADAAEELPEPAPGADAGKKKLRKAGDEAGNEKPAKKITLKEKKRLKKALEKVPEPEAEDDGSKSSKGADDSLKVLVAGLPFSAKEPDIKKFFKKCGKIVQVALLGRRLGKAVVTVSDEAVLESVLKLDGEKYGERWLSVGPKGKGKGAAAKGNGDEAAAKGKGNEAAAKGKGKKDRKDKGKSKGGGKGEIKEFEVFVAGFPITVGEATLKKTFKDSGEIDRFILPLDESGDPKGFACISFTTLEGMEKALELDQTDFCGETLLVRKRIEHKKGKGKGKGEEKSKGQGKGKLGCRDFEVFVGGLPYTTEESVIRKDFEECGKVLRFSMPLDDEGNHKGLAFISYADAEGMEKALQFHETAYGGVTIRVQRANAPRGSGFDKGDRGQGKAGADGGKGKKGKGGAGKFGDYAAFANSQGVIVESTGKRQTFEESDGEE